jgi:hypothetical protein
MFFSNSKIMKKFLTSRMIQPRSMFSSRHSKKAETKKTPFEILEAHPEFTLEELKAQFLV